MQLRNLQSLVEIGVDHNNTMAFPAPLMSTIQELGRSWPENRPRAPPSRPAATATTTPQAEALTTPGTFSSAVELPAPEAAFNTDSNGAPAARPR